MPKGKISLGITAGMAKWAHGIYKAATEKSYTDQQKADYAISAATGARFGEANPEGDGFAWDTEAFKQTWAAPAIGMGIHIAGKKLKLNKYLKKIPLVGDMIEF